MKRIAIFASGKGSNAENIIRYFKNHPTIRVCALFSNKPDAPALQKAQDLGVPGIPFTRTEFYESEQVKNKLHDLETDYIILAGFLWLVPDYLIRSYHDRIINIHPALLPDFGGKGMYGMKVHEAVIREKKKESGITIHLVNEHYDEGETLFRKSILLADDETAESLARKIGELEQEHFPSVIEQYIQKNL